LSLRGENKLLLTLDDYSFNENSEHKYKIKENEMGEKSADTQVTLIVQTQSLVNKQLQSNGSKVLLLQDGFILANDLLNNVEQLLTDVLGYYSEEGQWPVVVILDPEAAKRFEEFEKDNDNNS
jgi:hypothetical protein